MMHAFSRTELLLGKEGVEQLRQASVCVFGIGGVAPTWWRLWHAAAWGT